MNSPSLTIELHLSKNVNFGLTPKENKNLLNNSKDYLFTSYVYDWKLLSQCFS